jgi:hypothetical protein
MDLSGLIFVAGGVYGLLAVFRVVPVSKNPQANEQWLRKFGTLMKVLSPLIMVA